MRKFILPILFLHLAVVVNAATYYFSTASGDDSRTSSQAQNSSTPWKTISKLNSIMSTLKPGDQVLFNRGETFDGGIVATTSGNSSAPIFFGTYGSGNKPIINGFSTLTNWQQVSNNIWECTFSQASGKENMVTKNGKQMAIGRYPNSNAANGGYLTIDSHVGLTQLTSSQLSASPNWAGADIAIRKNRWVIDRSTVNYHSGNTVGFVSGSDNSITDKYGFFIENSPSTLDKDGEWWYDKSRTKLRMYFSGNNPADYTIKSSGVETLVTISFQNYLTFDNLTFRGANQYGFNLTNSGNIKINACAINFTGIDAVQGLSSPYLTISNSTINDANNNGIYLYWYCPNATITSNIIKRTAIIPGMTQNSVGVGQGMYVNGDYDLMQYNEVDSSGANGMHFEGNYSTIANNFINTFGFVLDDCGGIYTGQGNGDNGVYYGKSILNNIILNGIGAPAGTNDTIGSYQATQGIYLDANTNHVTVSGNTAANCGQTGIFSNYSTYISILNNTFYNNGQEQTFITRREKTESSVNVKGNIMFSKKTSQLGMQIISYYGSNNIGGTGTIDSNYYCRPLDNNYLFYDMYLSGGIYYPFYENLNTWRSKYGFDNHSKGAPALIPAFTYSNLSGVNKYTNGTYNTSVGDVGAYSFTGDMSKVWVNNKLDAGTLQVTSGTYSSANTYMLTLPLNSSVTAGKSYLLTFSLLGGTSNAPMTVYLRQNASPQINLTSKTMIPISTSRQEIQLGFTATASSSTAALELDVTAPNGAVWIDNVNLQEATITPTNPDDYILFQYNASTSTKTITLSQAYYDAKGTTYSGTVNMLPYTSLVLFKKSGTTTTQLANKTAQSISLQGNLTDASSAVAGSSATDLSWQVDNQNSTVSYYNVEHSADDVNYTSIGKAVVKNSDASSVNYHYKDAAPFTGKNYYRITQYDEKDVATISKVIVLNNINFRINPNPAHEAIHILFDQTIKSEDHLDKALLIRTVSGVTVKTMQLPSTDNLNRIDVNVGELKSGMYVLSFTADGKTISKSFLKQ